MKKGLIDNWTIERIIDNFDLTMKNVSVELQVLISALVLWDEVCYYDNGYSEWWKCVVDNNEKLKFLNMLTAIQGTDDMKIADLAEKKYISDYNGEYTSLVAKGALEYMYLADEKEMCYMPFNERAKFIRDNELYRDYNRYYTRMDVIENIDEEVLNYYVETNKIIRKANLGFETSCIYNYLRQESNSMDEMIYVIEDLKKRKIVKDFKKWIDSLENMISKGKRINGVVKEIAEYTAELKSILKEPKRDSVLQLSIYGFGMSIPINIKKHIKANMAFPVFLYREGMR